LSDFTELKGVTITIAGQAFEHLLYHYRLAYSGWQYVQVIQGGESFIGLSEGLQNALFACGGVPQIHRTDSLSAAYRNMAGKRYKPLTQLYDQLCEHYRMQPTRNNTGVAHENGAIEASHGHFKRRLTQQLYLRGSCDFESVADYQTLIEQVVATINRKCATKYTEEKGYLQPLPRYRVADYEELVVRVSRFSTIEVRCVLYSVPSRLIGQQLSLRLYHDRLVGYLGKQQVVELPRVRGAASGTQRRARCINYRHIIEGLRRKPRAFLYCTWQAELLPNEQWRSLWQKVSGQFEPDRAAKLIVEALFIAATQEKETAVADYLEVQLQTGSLTLEGLRQQFGTGSLITLPASTV
ncbi:MAG: DDE-type integrase/transposase/recombinase, partial [Cyanobacteria bacterium Co-bin8]|nr:DDE-type integrase/transposase/recombinase [Cyanobacteria bacterium Co-bin8]